MSGKKCPNCGACKECGAHPPQIVPMPYPVYPYQWRPAPWVSPYTQPFTPPQRWTYSGGIQAASGGTYQAQALNTIH